MNERQFCKRLDWVMRIPPMGRFKRLSMHSTYTNAYCRRPSSAHDWTDRFTYERHGYDFAAAWESWTDFRIARLSHPTTSPR